MSLPEKNRVLGLVVDTLKSAFHGYACREGTLLQYLRTAIARARVGDTIKIVYVRGTKRHSTEVKLGRQGSSP